VKLLIKYGCDVNFQDGLNNQDTLCIAAKLGNTEIVELLLSSNAKPLKEALYCAVKGGSLHCVQLILEAIQQLPNSLYPSL
jgi:hypothetical protein